jgi:hypothetical protein
LRIDDKLFAYGPFRPGARFSGQSGGANSAYAERNFMDLEPGVHCPPKVLLEPEMGISPGTLAGRRFSSSTAQMVGDGGGSTHFWKLMENLQ